MAIMDIVYLALVVICVIISLISTIIAMRKRKANATSVDPVESTDSGSFFEEMFIKTTELMGNAEFMFKKLGISDCGELKLDNVLEKLRSYAQSKGYTFDETKWKSVVNYLVSFANDIGHGNQPNQLGSTQTVVSSVKKDNIII